MEHYDVIIVGGGPAGLMAGVAAGSRGVRTLLVDKGDRLGRKLAISGGGRCNVTNNKELDELIRNIPGNGRFLYSALSRFSNRDIIRFFEDLGITLKEEDNGRMFPVSDKAKTVVDALVGQVRKNGVEIMVNAPVDRVLYDGDRAVGVRLKSGRALSSRCVVVASGGKSVPRTGSTGDGYAWAREAGHTITPLYPTEVPITSGDSFIRSRELQGLALRDVALAVLDERGKTIVSHRGDLLFTHFGLSGPIALRCSQFVVKQLAKGNSAVPLAIDLFPDRTAEEIGESALSKAKEEPKKAVVNALKGFLPERILPVLLHEVRMNPHATCSEIPLRQWRTLGERAKRFPVQADGTLSIEEAFVTGGGVHLREIDPKTMQSRLKKGLYFCGEILDVHGYTGGYNITAAFTTGYTAGTCAALLAAEESRTAPDVRP
jgi:hypothetical protein